MPGSHPHNNYHNSRLYSQPTKEKKKLQFHMANKIQIIPNNRQGQLNTGFMGTLAGVLKLAEIVGFLSLFTLTAKVFRLWLLLPSYLQFVPIAVQPPPHGPSTSPSRQCSWLLYSFWDTSASLISLFVTRLLGKVSSLW